MENHSRLWVSARFREKVLTNVVVVGKIGVKNNNVIRERLVLAALCVCEGGGGVRRLLYALAIDF